MEISLSALDEERFGIRTARMPWITPDLLPQAKDFCREHEVALLVANCRASERLALPALERDGFRVMDTIVRYERDLAQTPVPPDPGKIPIRFATPDDADAVAAVAAEAFRGYQSHYHADVRLDRARCEEVYPDWARRSCLSSDVPGEVLVAERDGALIGLCVIRLTNPQECVAPLAGVLPGSRVQGVVHSFAIRTMEWSLAQKAIRTVALIQLTNIPMQKAMIRDGFEPCDAYHTLHKWFDTP